MYRYETDGYSTLMTVTRNLFSSSSCMEPEMLPMAQHSVFRFFQLHQVKNQKVLENDNDDDSRKMMLYEMPRKDANGAVIKGRLFMVTNKSHYHETKVRVGSW